MTFQCTDDSFFFSVAIKEGRRYLLAAFMDPIDPISDLSWFSFFSRIVRLCVFKFSVWPTSTIYERIFLNRWHNHFAGSGYCSRVNNYNPARAEKFGEALETLGANKETLYASEAVLTSFWLQSASLKAKIDSLGGRWEVIDGKACILPPDHETQEWQTLYTSLRKIFKREEEVWRGWQCLITSDQGFLAEGEKKCVLLARLGTGFEMSRSEIAYFLGKGFDIFVYQPRGIGTSIGYPSEGGLYRDIEAAYQSLTLKQYNPTSQLWVYASCGGIFSAAHLFQVCGGKINMILATTPKSLNSVISRINCIARWIFSYAQEVLQAPLHSQCQEVENGFDAYAKIQLLPDGGSGMGKVLLLGAEGDTTAPLDEIREMAALFRQKGSAVTHLTSEKPPIRDGLTDPHLGNPLKDPALEEAINTEIFG